VITGRIESELVVEGDHAVNIYLRYTQKPCYLKHGFPGKITEPALDFLQDRYKVPLLPAEPFQDFIGLLYIRILLFRHSLIPFNIQSLFVIVVFFNRLPSLQRGMYEDILHETGIAS